MKLMKKIFNICLVFSVLLFTSCSDITDINENPNGVTPNTVSPELLTSTVMSKAGYAVINDGWSRGLGVTMQHSHRDSWSDNRYGSLNAGNFDGYFDILRNAELAHQRAVELESEFYIGITMILKAQIFATLADFYGDVPYTEALKGNLTENPISQPKYDSQESVYKGVISDLLIASAMLNKGNGSYPDANAQQDLYFNGEAESWVRYANSLALRYYMRFSEKDETFAKNGVEAMFAKDLILSVDQGCVLEFPGVTRDDSWPNNVENWSRSDFARNKPSATMVNVFTRLNDPRLAEWISPVQIQINVVPDGDPLLEGEDDNLKDGKRYISEGKVASINGKIYDPATWYNDRKIDDKVMVDVNMYVGLPASNQDTDEYNYNLNPNPERGGENVHVSYFTPQFEQVTGENLKVRILPASEVHFIMAEAAARGWAVNGTAEAHYEMGIQAAFDDWNVGGASAYIASLPAFNGMEHIMEQKWIAGFTTAHEAYFDWRRTGLPAFIQTGPYAVSDVIPVRSVYSDADKNTNYDNWATAVANLGQTSYIRPGSDGNDSPWAEPWIVIGQSPWE